MKTQTATPARLYQRTVVGLSLLALTLTAILGTATPAAALLAGGTKIINTASVDWDGNGAALTATVTVTVNTVSVTPVVGTHVTDATITASDIYTLESTAQTLTYYVTNKGTGLETITLADNGPNYSPTGVGNPTGVTGVTADITLGATVASSTVAGGTTITVPSDGDDTVGTGQNAIVNGISVGDFIVIDGDTTVYEVSAVTDNATTNTATITVTVAHTGITAGTQIGERGSVTVAFTTNTLTAPPTLGTYEPAVTATSAAGPATGTITVNVQRAALTITKEVSVNGGAFTAGPTTADPGQTLTYRITITNTGTAEATNVVISDTLPAYTTYVDESGAYRLVTATPAGVYAGATTLVDAVAGGDGYTWTVGTRTVTYSVASLAASGGNDVLALYFQVTIDNP